MLVRRLASLRDHALPAFAAGALPRLGVGEPLNEAERWLQRDAFEQRATLVEWQTRHVAAIEPRDVEDVVRGFAAMPPDAGCLAVEDRLARWQSRHRLDDSGVWVVLQQPVARQEPHLGSP